MVVHVGSTRIAAGVFVDGGLASLVVQEGSWDRLVRDVQENLQFRLGTTLGFNAFHKVVRMLARSFYERQPSDLGESETVSAVAHREQREGGGSTGAEAAACPLGEIHAPSNLRSFSEWGLIEYAIEDETISRAIDTQLKGFLFDLKKSISRCFSQLRGAGRGEIASDLFFDQIVLCGDIYFDPAAFAHYFSRLTGFRFETLNGHTVATGLKRILTAGAVSKRSYRELATSLHIQQRLLSSRV